MHSQRLESSFEPPRQPADSVSELMESDPVIEDFNAFFERLSSLDSLQWSVEGDGLPAPSDAPPAAQHAATQRVAAERAATERALPQRAAAIPAAADRFAPPEVEQGAAESAPPVPRVTRPAQPPGMAQRPRMTVLKSDRDLTGAPPAMTGASRMHGRATGRDVARFMKMVLAGLVLFGLGLGAGWAALSLPFRIEQAMPNVSWLMERTRILAGNTAAQQSRPAETDAAAPAEGAAPAALRVVEATGNAAAGSADAAQAPNAAPQKSNPARPVTGQTVTKQPVTARAAVAAVQLPSGSASANEPVAAVDADEADDAPATAGTTSAGRSAGQAAAAGPQYTLQVGACSSYACVENYRKLLLAKVGSRSIAVVTQARADGAQAIQRIRVQPLERGAAEHLKDELAAMDARFRDAYLIALK